MKFELKKSVLASVLKKATEVSTKAIKADFALANRACIVVEKDKLIVTATNGHLDFRATIAATPENGLKLLESGKAVITSSAALPVVQAMSRTDQEAIIEVSVIDDSLSFKNKSAKYKEIVSIETLNECKDVEIHSPRKPIYSLELDTQDGARWLKSVLPYTSKRGYKIRYQMVCIHARKDKGLFFVAGDSARFAVLHTPKTCDEDIRLILPEDQLSIVLDVIADNPNVLFAWHDKKSCFVRSGEIEMYIRGIPELEYINYEIHAFKDGDAKHVADFNINEYFSTVCVTGSVRDQEMEKNTGGFLSNTLKISHKDQQAEFAVDERRKASVVIDCACYKTSPDVGDEFFGAYCHTFLLEPASFNGDQLRFYLIDKDSVVIVRPIKKTSSLDDKGIPMTDPSPDGSDFRVFFASVKEKSSND